MLFEWYSGSDSSKEVPRAINRYADKLEELWPDDGFSPEDRHAELSAILEKEEEPNWQAYLLFYIGGIYVSYDKDRARPFLEQALSRFDILASSFRDVRWEHANCLYQLLAILNDADEEGWVELALRAVAFVEDMKPTEDERTNLISIAGSAFYELAQGRERACLFRVACDWLTVAHHVRPECVVVLGTLVYASYGAEDDATARRIYEMFEELDPDYEGRAELETFAKKAGIAKT